MVVVPFLGVLGGTPDTYHQAGLRRGTATSLQQDRGHPLAEAAVEYLDGHSLAIVANKFNVAIRTLRREFNKAGIATRPRQGWTY